MNGIFNYKIPMDNGIARVWSFKWLKDWDGTTAARNDKHAMYVECLHGYVARIAAFY